MIYGIRYPLFFLLFIAIMNGCGGKTPESMIPQGISQDDKRAKLLNQKIIEESAKSVTSADYQIGPGDLLESKVYEAQDLSTSVRVSSKGMVTYPLLGEVELGGLTVQEAERKLDTLLQAKYIKDPHVNIFIKEYRSKHVSVVGAVKNPGNYEVLNRGHLLDALAQAGGITENASRVAYVTHQGSDQQITVDLNELLLKGNTQLNVPVQMGDTIFVPEAGVFYVSGGGVRKQGEFPIKNGITVGRAVAVAGGLKLGAYTSSATLIRFQNGERQFISIDLKAIQKGEVKDVAIQDQDILYVGINPVIAFFDTIRLGFFFPPVSVSGQPPETQ